MKIRHRLVSGAVIAAAMATVGVSTVRGATFSATWVSAIDGTWTNAARWSTNPNFPNNGSPVAGNRGAEARDKRVGTSGSGGDDAVTAWAAKALPTVQHHLDEARKLAPKVK